MPKEGFEPSLPNGNYALNVARLPVPPLRLAVCILSQMTVLSTIHDTGLQNHLNVHKIDKIYSQVPYQ